jgi:hypothetical protein
MVSRFFFGAFLVTGILNPDPLAAFRAGAYRYVGPDFSLFTAAFAMSDFPCFGVVSAQNVFHLSTPSLILDIIYHSDI